VKQQVLKRNHVTVYGQGSRAMLFAHGFGCDQHMWRQVAPAFAHDYRVVLFDLVGAGNSDLAAYDTEKYSTLRGYADDVLEIIEALQLTEVVFVGHSVSAMIGVLAASQQPQSFARLVLVAPSPCYINDGSYHGGLEQADVEELLEELDRNHLGWSSSMGPVMMGHPERPELAEELTNSFCRANPDIARHFARVTFLSDNRADLPYLRTPALIIQCTQDVIAPVEVGQYLHQHLANSELTLIDTSGHCPHLSAPEATIKAMQSYLQQAEPLIAEQQAVPSQS
jgi:sigma-B regulation protein RsbQ